MITDLGKQEMKLSDLTISHWVLGSSWEIREFPNEQALIPFPESFYPSEFQNLPPAFNGKIPYPLLPPL